MDESWDSRLPTPLALDFSSLREEEDSVPNTQRGLSDVEGQDLYVDSLGYEGLWSMTRERCFFFQNNINKNGDPSCL